jgi:adenylate kinase
MPRRRIPFALAVGLALAGPQASADREPPHALVLLGPPGAGKSTQARMLADATGLPFVSTGALLRAEVQRGTPLGQRVGAAMARGQLVDEREVNRIVARRIARPDCARGLILDGYPRTPGEARFLDRLLRRRGFARPTVVELEVPEAVLLERLGARGRSDDTRAALAQRLRDWRAESAPLHAYYARDLHRIRGDLPREQVFRALVEVLPPSLRPPGR